MKKLKTMTQHVLDVCGTDSELKVDKLPLIEHAILLKTPLTLGQFVPCDENGEVLSEPELIDVSNGFDHSDSMWDEKEVAEYQAALSRVIFDGFSIASADELDAWNAYLTNGDVMIFVYNNSENSIPEIVFETEEEVTATTISDLTNKGLTLKD